MHKSCAFILYANNLSLSKTIYTIFHEIGHIKAQHKRANYYNFEINEEQEREADAFAQYAIAPPCVINEIGGTPENLIPIISAIKENTIQNILHKSKNSLTAVEKELIQLYQPYIIANKIKNPIEKQIKVIIASLIIVTWILLLFLGIKNIPDQQQSVIVPTQTQEKTNTRAVSENEVVWKSKTGDIYHTDSKCYHITKTAYKLNLDDAISAGFRKCKDCKK